MLDKHGVMPVWLLPYVLKYAHKFGIEQTMRELG